MITKQKELYKFLQLSRKNAAMTDQDFTNFPLRVPKSFVKRMKSADSHDPLLCQILPDKRELDNNVGFSVDPLLEKKYSPLPGVIRKYYSQVLLLVSHDCAVNCRFCFRRASREKIANWSKVFSYIENDSRITEVIFSGGDPLMLRPEKLAAIVDNLSAIPHVARIRIHSRVPIVMPERVTTNLLKFKSPVVLVVHCNHPNEINDEVSHALKLLRKKNIIVFNQSVLLRGINDDSATLIALSEKLFHVGVIPYYLHLLDKVAGAKHFYVKLSQAKKIYHDMKKRLPGYLLPRLVISTANRKKYVN